MASRSISTHDTLEWTFVLAGLLLAAIHLYLGLIADVVPSHRATQFTVIGAGFLAGVAAFFTPYWRPILHLVLVAFATYLGALWLLGGMEFFRYGALTGVAATMFILVGLALFVREERVAAEESNR